jgi:hypothetical protein
MAWLKGIAGFLAIALVALVACAASTVRSGPSRRLPDAAMNAPVLRFFDAHLRAASPAVADAP